MDVDPNGVRGDCGSGDWTGDDCDEAGCSIATYYDFAIGDYSVCIAKYGAMV